MTNEDKILELLINMQKDIVGLKQDVSGLKQDVSGLKQDVSGLKQDIFRLEAKTDEISKNQHVMQNDLSFLVRKTMDNSDDIRQLKLVK